MSSSTPSDNHVPTWKRHNSADHSDVPVFVGGTTYYECEVCGLVLSQLEVEGIPEILTWEHPFPNL